MKKAFLFVVLVIFAAGFVMAGGEQEAEGGAEQIPAINILINDSPWLPGFEEIVDMYQEETGNMVNLNITPFPGMLNKSRNAVQAETSEFDILNMNEMWYIQFYGNGWVTPIKEIDPDFELDPAIIEYQWATRWDDDIGFSSENGELYGLPINGNIQLYFYRKDLLDEAGMSVPQTWSEVKQFADAVHDPPNVYGYTVRTQPIRWNFAAYMQSYGGYYVRLDESTGEWEVGIHKQEVQDALTTWMDLGLNYGPKNYADIGQAEMLSLVSSGKLAQGVMVCASAPHFTNPDSSVVVDDIGAAVVPGTTPDTRATMTGIWVMGIPHNLPMERKEAALTFLEWALSKDAQIAYTKAGSIPVRQDVYDELSADPEMGWWMKAMADSTPYINAFLRIEETPQLNEVIDRRLGQAVIGELEPEEALWEAAQEIHGILEDAGRNVKPVSRE
jgi:multiple sugar transport system substrate-binding protein